MKNRIIPLISTDRTTSDSVKKEDLMCESPTTDNGLEATAERRSPPQGILKNKMRNLFGIRPTAEAPGDRSSTFNLREDELPNLVDNQVESEAANYTTGLKLPGVGDSPLENLKHLAKPGDGEAKKSNLFSMIKQKLTHISNNPTFKNNLLKYSYTHRGRKPLSRLLSSTTSVLLNAKDS